MQPSLVQSLMREAIQHHQAGRLAEAEQIYREILSSDPEHADSLHLLGMVAFELQRTDEAIDIIQKAIEIKSDAPSYHSNLGNVLQSQGHLAQAGACYQRALLLKPDSAVTYVNLGNIFREQGQLDSSLTCYRRALTLDAELPEATIAEASVLLLKGDFAAGWIGSERRWDASDSDTPKRAYPWPRWDGEPLPQGQLLIWGEQGIGDEIMFAGLVPDVIRSGVSCVLACDPRLQALFARSFPGATVAPDFTPEGHPNLDIRAHLPCASLPALFRKSITDFGATTSPYLTADKGKQSLFRARYSDGRKTVGVAWYTKNRKTGRSRSIDLSLLAPLFAVSGIRWVSLQYGDFETLETQIAAANAPVLVDRDVDQFTNVEAFAAQIAALDLVITIDNSAAHLAGALGVPTWLLLPFAPDWRWLLERNDSPWYPTMRIFRQQVLSEWKPVLDRVHHALEQFRIGCISEDGEKPGDRSRHDVSAQ